MKLIYAYTAGIVDADGYIGLMRDRRETASGIYFNPAVKVASIKLPTIDFLKKHFGGYTHKRYHPNPKHRDSYQWEIKNKKPTKDFLLKIMPFLVLKKRQAEIVIEYINRSKYSRAHSYDKSIKENEMKERMALYNELQSLR